MKKFRVFIYFNDTGKHNTFWLFAREDVSGYLEDYLEHYPTHNMTFTMVEFND